MKKQEPHHKDCPAVDGFGCHCDGKHLEEDYIIDQVEYGFETRQWAIENGLSKEEAEAIEIAEGYEEATAS